MGCHFLLWGNLPDPGIEPGTPALQANSLPSLPFFGQPAGYAQCTSWACVPPAPPLLQPLEVNAAPDTVSLSTITAWQFKNSHCPGSVYSLAQPFGLTPLPGSKVWPQCPRQEPQCPEAVPTSPRSPPFPFSTSSSKTSPSSVKIRLSSQFLHPLPLIPISLSS